MYALSNQTFSRTKAGDHPQSLERKHSRVTNAGATSNGTGDVTIMDSRISSREDKREKNAITHPRKKNSSSRQKDNAFDERKSKISGVDEPKPSIMQAAAKSPVAKNVARRNDHQFDTVHDSTKQLSPTYTSMATVKTGSIGVKTGKTSAGWNEPWSLQNARRTSSYAAAAELPAVQGEKEDSHIFQLRQTRNTEKSNAGTYTGTTAVGAVAVPGPMEETRRFVSFVSQRSHQCNQATPTLTTSQDAPIEATRVESEADIESQILSRMQNQARDIADMVHQQLMTNAAVPVNVNPSDNNIDGRESTGTPEKTRNHIFAGIVIAIIVAVVATAVAVSVSKQNAEQNSPPLPPPSPTSATPDSV